MNFAASSVPLLDAERDDTDRQQHERGVERQRLRPCGDGAEVPRGVAHVPAREAAEEVPDHPPADDAVVREDPEPREDPERLDDPPARVAEPVERVDGVEVRPAADDELRQDGREADDRDRDEVDEEERRPAVGRGLEREPPDVAQTDRAPDGREDEPEPGRPDLPVGHIYRL